MPSEFRSPRSLNQWFQLDYFQRRTFFRGWWRWPLVGAAAASILLLGIMWALAGKRIFQAGPLSTPHALFNDRCDLCHDQPFASLTRLWRGDTVGSVSDEKCLSCHAGSPHALQASGDHPPMGRCVDCHREHRSHAALVRIEDRACVACHRDLEAVSGWNRSDHSTPPLERSILGFSPGQHPPFRVVEDPGTIKFNHHYHLVEMDSWRQAMLARSNPDEGTRRRLDIIGKTALQCADCHQLEVDGRSMKPISYHDHCQRCHPLSASVQGNWDDLNLTQLAQRFAQTPLRHPRAGQTPEVVRADLRERLSEFIQRPEGKLFLDAEPPKDPERRLLWPLPTAPRAEKEFAWVQLHLDETERTLYRSSGGCLLCHHEQEPKSVRGLPKLVASHLPNLWWKRARFSHNSHRLMLCTECHDVLSSKQSRDVLLPTIELCLKCHNQQLRQGSVRADCVECHPYHDPASQRQARECGQWAVDQLLQGLR